jgi:hypothetical protein
MQSLINSLGKQETDGDDLTELGYYISESGQIRVDLHLRKELIYIDEIVTENALYVANFQFGRKDIRDDFHVGMYLDYKLSSLGEIFKIVKSAEEGIETLLKPENFKSSFVSGPRDIIRCLISLEDQVRRDFK